MTTGYLALGSNQGNRLDYLKQARELLSKEPEITVEAWSKIYETAPYGFVDQEDFLNAVVRISTSLSAQELLKKIHQIEKTLHRERLIRWGPRTVDIDILWLGDVTINQPNLIIPHIELTKRSFVLIPLKDVFEETQLLGKTIDEWISETGNANDVRESGLVW